LPEKTYYSAASFSLSHLKGATQFAKPFFIDKGPFDRSLASADCQKKVQGKTNKSCTIEMDSQGTLEDDPDPIVSEYSIYVKPRFKDGKKVYILQFPNRDSKQTYSAANSSLPLELRIKEKSGLLEIDVPIDTFRNYDREKGIKWGEAVRKSDQLKGSEGGSLGIAGGFGIGGGQSARPRSARQGTEDEGVTQEALMRDFATSVAQGRVLRKQTLGGQTMAKDNTTPQYMIGAFKNRTYYLYEETLESWVNRGEEQLSYTLRQLTKSFNCVLNSTILTPRQNSSADNLASRLVLVVEMLVLYI
jgi:hypothetical protein